MPLQEVMDHSFFVRRTKRVEWALWNSLAEENPRGWYCNHTSLHINRWLGRYERREFLKTVRKALVLMRLKDYWKQLN